MNDDIRDRITCNTAYRPAIEGLLVNRSEAAITTVSVQFALKSGGTLRGTAQAFYSSQIPPGGKWSFSASFRETVGTTTITRTETAIVSFLHLASDGATNVNLRMRFDPVFNPNLREWKAWEKINGKRQR